MVGGPGAAGDRDRARDADGRAPEGDDPGEIRLRGANLFSGYWPDGADGPDEDGWWTTGDLGILGPDGDLGIVDRIDDRVVVAGFSVYPIEVEQVLREVPGVADAAVIGVATESGADEVVAYLRATAPVAEIDVEALVAAAREHCGQALARFKQPQRYEVLDTLPVTSTGKVQRGRLRVLERRRHTELLK